MGFVLTVFYFVTNYLTPEAVFGALAAYRIELVLAVLITVISLPAVMRSFILKTPQSLALIGLAFAVFMSVVVGARWMGGGVRAFLAFIPNAFGYFLVCLHCKSKKKLQILVLMLLFVCLFVLVHGGLALLHAPTNVDSANENVAAGPYLMVMYNSAGQSFYRLRGLGDINDPNDFGQIVVCVIPLVFIFWHRKKRFSNTLWVVLPVLALLLAVFLTHSRGALLALTVLILLAARRRIGTVPALLLAGLMFAASMAFQFTGGRGISASAGEDRTNLWGASLQVFKAHPLFGVGFDRLPDYLGLTAHNSVAVCAAELGFVGLFFWCCFLFPTLRDALEMALPGKLSDGEPVVEDPVLFPQTAKKPEVFDRSEASRIAGLVLLSLVGFLICGWFLSRAFVMTLFLLAGMVEVTYEMCLERGMVARRLPLARIVPYSVGLAVALLTFLYILLRVVNLTH